MQHLVALWKFNGWRWPQEISGHRYFWCLAVNLMSEIQVEIWKNLKTSQGKTLFGWWFQIFFFSPLPGEDSHFDYIIFFRWVGSTTNKLFFMPFSDMCYPSNGSNVKILVGSPLVSNEGLCSTSETGPDFSTVGNVEKNGAMAITWKLMQMMRWCHHYQNHGQIPIPSEVCFFFARL